MRKLILAAVALLGFTLSTQAQEAKKATQQVKKEVKKATDKASKDAKVVLKKDGTPDKRYKQAKEVVLKKDGTPDKRYKQNK
ncbi:hypothetical protein KIH23_12665 [Flavobacterium sp. CYK-55]|uniref:hypothetical protein n=1 Tax=Flavobacterium sp. CYK-55 TaxID=2835529 RepID=UPI001BCA7B83|nr:hypothetical protein [Flavobacterium sp. CYK-55]MBS7788152.1 hypothetical protein [Flavobacterium sp. CYK-55]